MEEMHRAYCAQDSIENTLEKSQEVSGCRERRQDWFLLCVLMILFSYY